MPTSPAWLDRLEKIIVKIVFFGLFGLGEPPEATMVPPETLLPEPILVQPDSILVPPESSLVALGSILVPTESTTPPPKTILLPPLIFSAHTEGSFVLVFLRPERGVHGFLRPHHRDQNSKLGKRKLICQGHDASKQEPEDVIEA